MSEELLKEGIKWLHRKVGKVAKVYQPKNFVTFTTILTGRECGLGADHLLRLLKQTWGGDNLT